MATKHPQADGLTFCGRWDDADKSKMLDWLLEKGYVSEFCEIDGLPGYRFLADGTIQSQWVRGSKNGRLDDSWHEVRPRENSRRKYHYVTLKTPAGRRHFRVNVLILWAFTGSRPAGMEAAHKDGDRLNNRVDNLVWKTHAENIADKHAHGTVLKGEQIHGSKLTEPLVAQIKGLLADGVKPSVVAGRFGVSESLVRMIGRGKRWSHVEFH